MNDPLMQLLKDNPNCRVTINTSRPRRQPKTGDTKVTRGRTFTRRQRMARSPSGRPEGYLVSRGRPRWEWVAVDELIPPRGELKWKRVEVPLLVAWLRSANCWEDHVADGSYFVRRGDLTHTRIAAITHGGIHAYVSPGVEL